MVALKKIISQELRILHWVWCLLFTPLTKSSVLGIPYCLPSQLGAIPEHNPGFIPDQHFSVWPSNKK